MYNCNVEYKHTHTHTYILTLFQLPCDFTAIIADSDEKCEYPCRITVNGCNNHSMSSAASLSELRRSKATTEKFHS